MALALGNVGTPILLTLFSGLINGAHKILVYFKEKVDKIVFCRTIVDILKNPRCKRAFLEEIKSRNLHVSKSTLVMMDCFGKPDFEVPKETYTFSDASFSENNNDVNIGNIYVSLDDNQIVIKSCQLPFFRTTTKENFIKYIGSVYSKHNSPSKVLMFFTSDNDKWSIPICRQPRDFSKIILTADMQAMVGDVQGFMKNKDVYASKGLPFKRGYLLYGSPGTGKSTCIEVIANMYNMSVYILTLNSRNMTDTTLINLLCRVPPNSIITIEEIDKQMVTLKKNKTANVSVGGLLTAIDGPQRLSHSTIVIMTANTANFLSKGDMFALCRPGRIDQTFNFSTKFFQ